MKKSKVRNTLAKKIESSPDTTSAIAVACEGRIRTEAESLCDTTLDLFDLFKKGIKKSPGRISSGYTKTFGFQMLEHLERKLHKEVITAILTRDAATLYAIARRVEGWKSQPATPLDNKANRILFLKLWLDKRGEKMTIRELANRLRCKEDLSDEDLQHILLQSEFSDEVFCAKVLDHKPPDYKDTGSATDDGHAALRRLCKKLKFPIAPAAQGRPKIIKTRKEKREASKS